MGGATRSIDLIAAILFGCAIVHTFLSSRLQHLASLYPEGSVGENFFHLLGEVEVIFGIWAAILVATFTLVEGTKSALVYAENLNFTEPMFVLAIMAVSATRPVIQMARKLLVSGARLWPKSGELGVYVSCLVLGPLLGSFITEPAAMTVTALILKERYFAREVSPRFKYLTLAILFVNVSIGGVLTHFAAPPVLMVASRWEWGISFMLTHFGWKAAIATVVNAAGAAWYLRRELGALPAVRDSGDGRALPVWLVVLHSLFLALIVVASHHPVIFMGAFLFFLGVAQITQEYQDELKLRQSFLVAFFLGGLVVLGGLQKWWLDPLIRSLNATGLFLGATFLTSFTDNAALTYLGSQVEGVSEAFKYALVSGAVAGGGMTVIANAPNPAGYSILQENFGVDGISPLKLAAAAAVPTLVAMMAFWLLP